MSRSSPSLVKKKRARTSVGGALIDPFASESDSSQQSLRSWMSPKKSPSSKKQRRSPTDEDQTEEAKELEALRERNQKLQAESSHYRSLVAITAGRLPEVSAPSYHSTDQSLTRRAVDTPAGDLLHQSTALVGQLRSQRTSYMSALRAAKLPRTQRLNALDPACGAVIDELLHFAIEVLKAYATDTGGAHPLSQPKAAAGNAPNFRHFCETLGAAAVALPIGKPVQASTRGDGDAQKLATRNSWAARLIDAIKPSGSYAIMAKNLAMLHRWQPKNASFTLLNEGHSRADLFDILREPVRAALAQPVAPAPFAVVCAVHAKLLANEPTALAPRTASHAYTNLCRALGLDRASGTESITLRKCMPTMKTFNQGLKRLLLFHALPDVDASAIPSVTAFELLLFAALGGLLITLPANQLDRLRFANTPENPLSPAFEATAWSISTNFSSVLLFDAPPHPDANAYLTQVYASMKLHTLLAGGVRTRALPTTRLCKFLKANDAPAVDGGRAHIGHDDADEEDEDQKGDEEDHEDGVKQQQRGDSQEDSDDDEEAEAEWAEASVQCILF